MSHFLGQLIRVTLASGAVISTAAGLGIPILSQAAEAVQSEAPELRIPAQPLGDALRMLATQTSTQILIPSELVAGRQSAEISGRMTVTQALERLLQGTGLAYEMLDARTINIERAPTRKSSSADSLESKSVSTMQMPAAPASTLEEVVVTAQKRSENIQSTAVAVSAISAEDLENASIRDITDLNGIVPGLVVSGVSGFGGSYPISIRGVSGQSVPAGAEEAVGVYLDGVYLARPEVAFFSLADVERVEVLRGPQGTLYGRNTTGGAVNIITKNPSESLSGSFGGTLGNYDDYNAKGYLSGPLGGGFSASVSGVATGHDGYFTNTVTGNDLGDLETYTGRAKLRYASADDRFDAVLAYDYTHYTAEDARKNLLNGQTGAVLGLRDPDEIATEWEQYIETRRRISGLALTASLRLTDELTLTSVTSDRRFSTYTVFDGDGGPTVIAHVAARIDNDSISQELRANYSSDRLKFVVGANYYEEDSSFFFGQAASIPVTPTTAVPAPLDTSTVEAYAVFGQLDYELFDGITATLGGRWSSESRDFTIDYTATNPGRLGHGSVSDDHFLPKLGLSWQVTDAAFLYATATKGRQAGGFAPAPGAAVLVDTFKPESTTLYEVGAKTEWFDRRLRLNTAVFSMDYENMQVRQVLGIGVVQVSNAASASISGVELEVQAILGAGFDFSGSASYLDAEYDDFPDGALNYAGNRPNRAPERQFNVRLGYERRLTDTLALRGNMSYAYESLVFYTPQNDAFARGGPWESVDARLGVVTDGGLEFYVYGRNLTDDRYISHVSSSPPRLQVAIVNAPTRYGFGVTYQF